MVDLTKQEIDCLLDALRLAASRRESMAHAVQHGRHHDLAAEEMRRLRIKLMKAKLEQPR